VKPLIKSHFLVNCGCVLDQPNLEANMRARAIAVCVTALVLSATGFLPDPAWAQSAPASPDVQTSAIGKVVTVKGSVTIEHANAVVVQASVGPGTTKAGDPVYLGDVVQTGRDGRIGISFTDDTTFDLSSNARMVLNEFVYDPNGKSNSTLFSLTKGTFTFIAGKVAKTGDMKIDTPVATMGIRGTTPHVEISEDGTVKFSTLIEEGKNKVTQQKRGAVGNQRQAKGPPPPHADSVQGPALKLDKPKLTICRGC
jgi:hypothetical protein